MTGIQVPSTLNSFISVCRDTQAFYEKARDMVDDPRLMRVFAELAELRADTIAELAQKLEDREAAVTSTGTVAGLTHRVLAGLRVGLSSDETKDLIAHVVAEEERAFDRLAEIAREPLPDPVRDIVKGRLESFRVSRDLARGLQSAIATS